MPIHVRSDGPIPARIMLVGEAPGSDEELKGIPFVGSSGMELNRMLHEAGIMRSECFVTNVCRIRPLGNDITTLIAMRKKDITPNHIKLLDKHVLPPIVEGYNLLMHEISEVKPNVIVAFGNTSLWALTGKWGIGKWRGSLLHHNSEAKVIPTYHPAAILRQWEWRSITVSDLRRAAYNMSSRAYDYEPKWEFQLRPSFTTAISTLRRLLSRLEGESLWIDFDFETRAGHIACIGVSWSLNDAICIPFMCVESQEGYWNLEEEAEIVHTIYHILTHKNALIRGQNLLYDCQYTFRHWHFIPRVIQDTMISHHTLFPGLPKRLDFQASMYCAHPVYWKDDGKEWDKKMGEDQLWQYNCVDCVRTREVGEVELLSIEKTGLQEVEEFQQKMFYPVLQAMTRGVKVDVVARREMARVLSSELDKREEWFRQVLGHPLNPRSSPQMQNLFYTDLKQPIQIKKGTGKPTLDDNALDRLKAREPLLRPLIKSISEYRSLGVFKSTFIEAELDHDGRIRCSYNLCGTHTYRLSSSTNAFGGGTNLQNIPGKFKPTEPDDLDLPNIRKMFIPDDGFTFFDLDLKRADLQVVIWEAGDEELKKAIRLDLDLHCFNALSVFDIKGIPPEELQESHPRYREHRERIGETKRHACKEGVHATNYGVRGRTLAATMGTTIHEADRFISKWMGAHPGIRQWHERVLASIAATRSVENKFGYRRVFFDRPEGLLPEALAWIPQSTVAVTINHIWLNLFTNVPEIQVLLQVHDSLAGQFPSHLIQYCLNSINVQSQVTIPYDDPLIIPIGIKTSEKSWGDCESKL